MTDELALPEGVTIEDIKHAFETMSLEEMVAFMPESPDTAELVAHYPNLAAVEVRDVAIAGRHGEVRARHYRVPGDLSGAGLVWVHGGGFIGGDLDMAESHWVGLTIAARGFPVLAVEYTKCLDGVHYPVPSDDILDAWLWACANSVELGTTADRLHIGGASAGGNLTAGVVKRLRDDASPMPASLVLVYGLVHPELPPMSESLATSVAQLGSFTPEAVRGINLMYVDDEAGLADPYAFAANGDTSGQPPVYVLNSEADSLRASGEAYAAQLENAGVVVKVEFEPGTGHGHLNQPFLPGGERSLDRIAEWLDS